MTYEEIIEKIKPELQNLVDSFKTEMMKIQAGRLSPGFLENIKADCFGSVLPLKQLGAISSVSPRGLLIQLWDKSYVEGVVKAIEQENLGLSMRMEENNIYLTAPSLTEETRQNLIQLLREKKEEAFQNIRRLRDKAWKGIQEGFQRGEIREDDKYRGKDKLDEIVRKYRDKMEEMTKNKETEIKG